MNLNLLPLLGMAFLGQPATAQDVLQTPGSLLLFHEFDNRAGVANLITVTNTANGDLSTDTVDVHYVYRARYNASYGTVNCLETNRTRRLTPNDTISVLTKFDNPNYQAGYLYCYAESVPGTTPIKFDHLIGSNLVIDGLGLFDYSVNPAVFKAGSNATEDGDPTDGDSDGIRDLDGQEYSEAPDEILIPRFLGQDPQHMYGSGPGSNGSALVLVNLTGGQAFDAIIDFLIYNDNEEAFSSQYQFRCWDYVSLLDISGLFANDFLLSTNHALNEIPSAEYLKSGWMRLNGNVAFSSNTSIADPAFLAVLIEKVGGYSAASLPFGQGTQNNGDLLPLGIGGDPSNAK